MQTAKFVKIALLILGKQLRFRVNDRNLTDGSSILCDKVLFEGLVTHKKEHRHCEPVRTLAWQSPGSSGIFVGNRYSLPFNGGIAAALRASQ